MVVETMIQSNRTMKKIIKLLLIAAFLFIWIIPVSAGKQQLSLAHFLKSRYLGTTISYYDKVIKKGKSTQKGVVANVVLGSDGYYFILEDEIWIKVVFQVTSTGDRGLKGTRFVSSKRDLQIQMLQAEEFLNSSISKVGTDGTGSTFTPITSISKASELLPASDEDFTSAEEIIYTDVRTDRQKKGNVLVSPGGIVLEDGSPISIEFVSGIFGKKN